MIKTKYVVDRHYGGQLPEVLEKIMLLAIAARDGAFIEMGRYKPCLNGKSIEKVEVLTISSEEEIEGRYKKWHFPNATMCETFHTVVEDHLGRPVVVLVENTSQTPQKVWYSVLVIRTRTSYLALNNEGEMVFTLQDAL